MGGQEFEKRRLRHGWYGRGYRAIISNVLLDVFSLFKLHKVELFIIQNLTFLPNSIHQKVTSFREEISMNKSNCCINSQNMEKSHSFFVNAIELLRIALRSLKDLALSPSASFFRVKNDIYVGERCSATLLVQKTI